MGTYLALIGLVTFLVLSASSGSPWDDVTSVLKDEEQRHTYPGCQAAVLGKDVPPFRDQIYSSLSLLIRRVCSITR